LLYIVLVSVNSSDKLEAYINLDSESVVGILKLETYTIMSIMDVLTSFTLLDELKAKSLP